MHFYATLRSRLVLLVLAAVLPLVVLSIAKAVGRTDAAIRVAAQELQTDAALLASTQQQMAETARQVLIAVANAPDVQDGNAARCSAYLATLNRLYTVYANLGIIGSDGYARCHGMDPTSPTYLGDRSYFRDAVARRGFVSGEYIFGRLARTHVFGFALPTLDAEGRVKQVAYVVLDLAALSASVAHARLPPGGRLAILDRNGTVLAANPPASGGIGSKLRSPVALAAVKTMSSGVQEGLDGAGRPRIFAYQPSSPGADAPFFVVLSIDRDQVVASAHRQLNLELLLLGLVALLGGAIAWAMGRPMIVRPTQAILQATQRLKDGERDVRIAVRPVDAGSEFSLIAEGFNRMADALAEREAELKSELAKSQLTQRKLLDAQRMGRIGHSELDLATGQVVLSDEVRELFGLAPGAFDGRAETVFERVHPDDRDRYRQIREDAMRNGSDLDIEYRIVTPAGEQRWIHQIGRAQHNEAGVAVSRIGVMQDITARKRTELALAEATDLLRRTGEIANIGGWELVIDDMLPIWSDQVYRIHELDVGSMPSLDEAIGFYTPESRPVISAAVQAGIDHGTPWDLELPMVTATGRLIWARSQGQAVMQEGKVARLVGTLQDITARKLAEQAMHESEQRYAALFAEAPAPMWVFDDVSYEFRAVNEAAIENYGYARDEVLAMTMFGIHPVSDHARLRKRLSDKSPLRQGAWLHRRKDGTMFPVSVVSKLIQYGGRPARFLMALDLTAQREAEATVQEHLFTLQRAADAAQAISWHQSLDGMMQEVAEQARGVIGVHQAFVSLSLESAPGVSSVALSVSQSREALWNLDELPGLRRLFAPVLSNNRSMRLNQAEVGELAGKCESVRVPPMRGCLVVGGGGHPAEKKGPQRREGQHP
jgi:PAS domain S-box-containing protein